MSPPTCCGFGTSFESKRWLSLDPCGVLGVSLSWGVHLYAMAILPTFVLGQSYISWIVFGALYVPSAMLALSSLFMASTTDPGAVPLGARPLVTIRRASSASLGGRGVNDDNNNERSPAASRSVRRCHKCGDNYKPPRAHHDSVTDRCIVKFDHFCPWVNNSIGALNHKFFCLFLFYTAITCLLSLLLLLLRLINCSLLQSPQKEVSQQDSTASMHSKGTGASASGGGGEGGGDNPHHRVLTYSDPQCDAFYSSNFVLGLLIASLLFLIFTASMGCEQLDAIETGKGKIARMKMSVGSAGTEFARVTEEFNEMFGGDSPRPTWHWFVPLPVRYPRGMEKVVLGYDWDERLPARGPYQEEEGSESSSSPDRELDELEAGTAGSTRESRPTSPLVPAASPSLSPPPMPRSSRDALDRTSSQGSVVSVEAGGVKNRRPRSLDGPLEIV